MERGLLFALAFAAWAAAQDARRGWCRFALDVRLPWDVDVLVFLIIAIIINGKAGAQRRKRQMLKVGKVPPRAMSGCNGQWWGGGMHNEQEREETVRSGRTR